MCARDLSGGVQVKDNTSLKNAISIDSEAAEVTAQIVPSTIPVTCEFPLDDYTVELVIDPSPRPPVCEPPCDYYDPGDVEFISWSRDELSAFPVVTFKHPDHCQLIFTLLVVAGHPDEPVGNIEQITIFEGGEIPASKQDAHGGGFTDTLEQLQNTIAPGLRFEIHHVFSNGSATSTVIKDFAYWCTCCLTGGEIVGVNGPDDETRTYTVNVMGVNKTAKRLDFINWQTGDWVFLAPFPITSECQDDTRARGCKGGCANPTDVTEYVILPLEIGNYGD